jgi:hypothetical protein
MGYNLSMEPPERNRIDRMERGLYSRKNPTEIDTGRSSITRNEFDVNGTWQQGDSDLDELLHKEREKKEINQGSLFKKILIGSAIFFVLATGIAAFLLFGGVNFVSGNNIDIAVVGPTNVGGGQELSLDFVIKNNNTADLTHASLLVEYPPGARVAGDVNTELTRQREVIDLVTAKGEIRKTLKSVLFGEKDSIQQIKLTFEYKVKGSSAVFLKNKTYDVVIASSPIIVTITNPKEVNSNQQVEFNVDIASNNADILHNILFKTEYPFGFTFQSSDPKPTNGNNSWQLGDLAVGGKQTIKVRGVLQGQNEEERTFKFSTGISLPNKIDTIGAVFSLLQETIKIKKPFIGVDVILGGSSDATAVASPGQKVQTNISLTNNLSTQLLDTQVTVELSGAALDQSSVSVSGGGFYRSIDNTIIWEKNSSPELKSIEPGSNKVVNFLFAPSVSFNSGSNNQVINIKVTVTGNQVVGNSKPQVVSTVIEKKVLLASNVNLGNRLGRSVGPFENSGPIPPRANLETTYTVTWSLTNSLNTISQTKVTAQLPPYVKWVGLTDPSLENVTFDPLTNKVTWNVSDLQAGTGIKTTPREASFQISFTPSITQVGTSPMLVQSAQLVGTDRFTGSSVNITAASLNTKFSSDPMYRSNDETVVK